MNTLNKLTQICKEYKLTITQSHSDSDCNEYEIFNKKLIKKCYIVESITEENAQFEIYSANENTTNNYEIDDFLYSEAYDDFDELSDALYDLFDDYNEIDDYDNCKKVLVNTLVQAHNDIKEKCTIVSEHFCFFNEDVNVDNVIFLLNKITEIVTQIENESTTK